MVNFKNKIGFILVLALIGCSKTAPSTAISEATQKDIITIQKDIEKSACDNKDSLLARLDTIKSDVKNISLACETEKNVIIEQVRRLKLIIAIFLFSFVILVYAIIKKR